MNVFSGSTAVLFVNVIIDGQHIDADTDSITAVLASNPTAEPEVERLGVGRYKISFTGLAPELIAGQTTFCTISGEIGSVAWSPYDIAVAVLDDVAAVDASGDEPETLEDLANRPRVVQAGTERIEEHSLADQIAFAKYKNSQESATATPGTIPVMRWRQTHGRP